MSGGKKKHQRVKMTFSLGEMKRALKETADAATKKIMLLTIVAAQDEFDLTDDQVIAVANRMQNYVDWEEQGLVDLEVASESLHRRTGIDLRLTRW